MGNIVQCCHTLSNYFKCKDVPPQREQERSPLLSSEEGECDPSSEPDDVEEDEFYTSTNPTLEPGNFLFPDIILSSSFGGDMTLVEPMVCLLVSEEEERVRVFEEGDAEQAGRYRGNSEVETQTEMETQVGTGVQTQTELRTHSEIFVCHDSTVESKVKTLTNTGTIDVVCGEHEILRREDVLVDAQMSQERHAEKQKMRAQSETWTDADSFVELEVSGRLTERTTLALMEAKREELKGTQEELSTILSETLTEDKENVDEYIAETESQRNVQLTEHVENFNPVECVALTPQIDQSADQAVISAHHIQGREKTQQTKRIEDPSTLGLLEAEGPAMSLNSADRLFLTGSHFKAPLSEDSSNDGLCQPPDVDKSKQFSIHDAADLKDTSFTLRIQPPGTETFELQVSGQLLVAELHQVLMEHEITCQRTCFSLQMGGAALDNHAKLCSIQGMQDGALIKVEEELYSVRDAHLHLKHVRALLRSLDPADAHNGVNCSSLSYVGVYTRGDKGIDGVGNRRPFFDIRPSEYLLPGCKDRPLMPLHPVREDRKPLQCLRVLTLSSWNPPPGNRKMHGDLMYLNVLTMEGKELNITSSTRGFYINQSTAFNFNPKPAEPKILCHSLVELLNQISPAFRKSFIVLQKKRVQQHPYERIATPFQVFTWIAPQGDYTLDSIRAEETQASRVGQEEHTAGQTRDWNEELQACRELSRRSFQECLHRERMIFKTNSDFVGAATRGAVAVIDGNVMPLNPGEAPHMQMFIWNNLFFSLGFDISDHYRPLGGNSAAHAAAVCDLRGAQAYSNVDAEGLHTVGTAVVDYRGIRVIAQTIVPGLLEKHQEQTVVYGSNDYGKTVFTHPRFLELLGKTSKQLRIQRHQVLDHNNSPVELCSGIETKGIFGNDSRAYVLDLLRTLPPDLNFQFSDTEGSREVPEECKSFGYPRRHHHTLASLRPELIEAFVQHRYEMYVKMVPQSLNQLENLDTSIEQKFHRRTVIGNACKAVGSVSESCFDIRFNPDVCSPGVRFSSECVAEVQKQRMLLWDAAAFLLSHQIPALLRDCLDHTAVPMDGLTLTSALHQRGVNVRYLGTILMELERAEERRRLSHIQRISLSEVIIRSAKHIFQTFLQDVEPAAFSAAVSHFLNCLLNSSSCVLDSCSDELVSRRRSRRRRSQRGRVALLKDNVWTKLTPSELWSRIKTEVGNYFHYTIDNESIDEVIEKHSLQRISLLREIAIKTGIQVQLREYVFDSRHRPAFSEEDVINMFPVVKHLKHTASDAKGLVQHARVLIQQGHVKDGYDLINQALVLFISVCGVLHEDACMCLHLLGRLSYIMGEYADALSHQEKAVINSERVQGIDHPQTIHHYTHLALYCFAGGRQSTSLQLLYRARYLTLLVSGEDHPHIIQVDSMLGLILHGLMEYELSLTFLQNALSLTSKYYGTTSLNCAHSHHLLAAVYDSKGDFHSAVQHEKEAHSIYYNQAGEDHDITKESSEYLSSLTQQALSLQNPTERVCRSTPSTCTPSAKFSAPSCPTILRQLNLKCGIIELSVQNTELRMGIQEMWKSWK